MSNSKLKEINSKTLEKNSTVHWCYLGIPGVPFLRIVEDKLTGDLWIVLADICKALSQNAWTTVLRNLPKEFVSCRVVETGSKSQYCILSKGVPRLKLIYSKTSKDKSFWSWVESALSETRLQGKSSGIPSAPVVTSKPVEKKPVEKKPVEKKPPEGMELEGEHKPEVLHHDQYGDVRIFKVEGSLWFSISDVLRSAGLSSEVYYYVKTKLWPEEVARIKLKKGPVLAAVSPQGILHLLYTVDKGRNKKQIYGVARWLSSELSSLLKRDCSDTSFEYRFVIDKAICSLKELKNLTTTVSNATTNDGIGGRSTCDSRKVLGGTPAVSAFYTPTEVASLFGMSTVEFNRLLETLGIQFKLEGGWALDSDYDGLGYTSNEGYFRVSKKDGKSHGSIRKWTESGLNFLKVVLESKGICLV